MQPYDYDYNISVIGPEDEEQQGYDNALRLHHGFGHHSTATSGDVNQVRGGNRSFSFDPRAAITRPQLPQLTTDLSYSPTMRPTPNYPTGSSTGFNQSSFTAYPSDRLNSYYPPSWVQVNETYYDPHSPSNYNRSIESSPNPSGLSPLQPPLTPILGVDNSPSSPQFPSPGSQGSAGSLNPSPSPHLLSHPLTPGSAHGSHLSLDRFHESPAIVRSSPVPQYTGLHSDQHVQTQYNTGYGSDNHNATAQGNFSTPYTYTGLANCAVNAQTIPQVSYSCYDTTNHSVGPVYSSPNPSPAVERMNVNTNTQQYPLPQMYDDGFGPIVPQRVYKPHTASDRRRYVEQAVLEPPVVFRSQEPPQLGISLRDALQNRFMRLKDRDELMFVNRGPSISVRLVWEGYQPWSRQIPTRDFKSPPGPITRQKLAKNVAKTIVRFIDEHLDGPTEPSADPRWQVGPGKITVDDLVLVSLHHVSMGSWQANLRLTRPLTS